MTILPVTVLVVAKAPVPGLAKTRLAADVGVDVAAEVAAAALLDTLDVVADVPVSRRVVALTGDLDAAVAAAALRSRLRDFVVVPQRGDGFADRLANAHLDAARAAGPAPVLQIGMDTPQVTAALITRCAETLLGASALLGMADDGGWWVLGVRSAATAGVLRTVPMSRRDTGVLTYEALREIGVDVTLVETLRDVDTVADVPAVRAASPAGSRFVQATKLLVD